MKSALRIDSRGSRGNEALNAFSLVEVMVAVALLAVIIVGLLAMFYQTQRAFRSGMTQVDVLEGGRATLELISRDVQEMAASFDGSVTNLNLFLRYPDVPRGKLPLQIQLPNGVETVNAFLQDVSFFRKINDEWVGESFRVFNTNGDIGLGTLSRVVTNAHWSRIGQLNLDLPSTPPAAYSRMADGIVHFRMLPYDENGILITNNVTNVFYTATGYAFTSNALPAAVEIEIAIVEPRVLEQFNIRASFNQQSALDYLSKQAGRIHFLKQRIPIRNAPRIAYYAP